ncbi:ZNF91 [Branchiostoma lanceolatum]|uniref:ZNF91 protein n=1 Tax=Branchiostoma lanceolatum TaxID=7740 RepID=A0A8J9ZXT7_BRALA|nr:ZNF91 [Branchiostoma lanceolatum]
MEEEDRYWCDFCGTYEDDVVCPNLGPIQAMQDSEVQSRARASLPKGLAIQKTSDGQEGVFASVPMSARMQFGPLEAQRVQAAPQGIEHFPLKVFNPDGSHLYLDTTDEEVCNWMKFVRPATRDTEQNLVAYQKGTDVFFLTQKDIPVGGELQVWYAPSYAKKMGQHLLTPGGHLLQGEPSLVVTQDKVDDPAPVQPRADKHSTTSIVSKTGEQEVITNEMDTSVGQSKSPESDFQQTEKVTRWNVQENVINRVKADPLTGPRVKQGKGQGQSKPRRKKASTVPGSRSVTKAKEVNANKTREKIQTPILCAGCADVFENEDVLKEHIEKEHPDEVEPGRKRPKRSSVKCHFCQVCQDSFSKNSELLFHSSTRHAEDLNRAGPSHWQVDEQDEGDEWNVNEESDSNDKPVASTKRRKLNGAAKKKKRKKKRTKKECQQLLENSEQMWCAHCDVTFNSPSAFNQHRRIVHGFLTGTETKFQAKVTTFDCQQCSAPFCSPLRLKKHALSLHESNETAYKCDTCPSEFSLPKDLHSHLKREGSECKVHCQDCDQSFASLATARVHQQQKHGVLKCHPCGQEFANAAALSKHVCGRVQNQVKEEDMPSRHQTAKSTNSPTPRRKDWDPALRWCKYCDLPFQATDASKKHMLKYHNIGLGSGASSVVLEYCSLCNAPFTFRKTLRSHLQEVHKVYPDLALQVNSAISPVHECDTCCKKFQGPAQLQDHLEERMGECTMSCQQCGESFDGLPSLRLHDYNKHSMVECKLCHESFINVNSLGRHMKKVHEKSEDGKSDYPDWCQYCDMSFAEKKSFSKHMKACHGVGLSGPESPKLQHCNLCDAPFTNTKPKSMLKHVQDVHGVYMDDVKLIPADVPKTHKCPTCLTVLQGPHQLQAHLVDRNGQCRMTCKECPETFDSLPLLRSHEDKRHRSIKCMLCEATFRNATGLKGHMKRMHNPDGRAVLGFNQQRWCPYCDQTFIYTGSFTKHMKDFHYPPGDSSSKEPAGVPEALPHCDVCDAPFTSHKLLTKHIHEAHRLPAFTKGDATEGLTQTHQCETCCETFRCAKHLDDHLRSSQGKCRATCSLCNEAFPRLSSLRVHQAEECSKKRNVESKGKQGDTLRKDSPFTDPDSIVLATLEQQWCSYCDLILSGESALSKHVTEWHEEESVPEADLVYCRTCNSPFTGEEKLLAHCQKLHKISHASVADLANRAPSPVQCGSCPKGFSSVQGMEEHLMARNQACSVDCKTCGMRFHSILRLRWHEYRTHANSEEGLQPEKGGLVCDICSSFFNTAESLANHLSSHAGQDVYQCTVCGKAQRTIEELISHLEEEHSQKHRCPMCAVVCQSASQLRTHIKQCKKSAAKKFFSCELCKVRFMGKSALRNHQALQHSGPGEWLGCPHCEYRTQDGNYQLWKHFAEHDLLNELCEEPKDDVRSRSVTCTLCETGIPEKGLGYHLKKHQKVEYKFKCRLCPREFFTDEQLRQHTDKHIHQGGVITCPICDCPIWKSRVLSKHLKKVHQRSLYQCPVCQKEMIYRKSYEDHLATHKGDIVLEARLEILTRECEICGRRFPGQRQMERHRDQVHMNVRKFKCDVCGKDFKRKAELIIHMSVHTGVYSHLCMYCGKAFKVQACLKQHITIHLNIKKHACHLCGKAFNQKCNLRKHQESHNASKEFQCDACGKTFQHSDTLRMHMRLTHLDEGKSCRYCGKKFIRESVLKVHEDAVHNGIRNKMCGVCGHVMTYNHSLRRHFRRAHPDLFDEYFPASATGKGNPEKKVGDSLSSSAGGSKLARQGRKRGQKDRFTTLEPTPSQPLTMSTGDRSRGQKCEEEEMLSAIETVVADSSDRNKDSHTTFIIINDQNSAEENVASSAQVVEEQATMTTVTTLDHWVPRQFQGNAGASSCEIIMPAAEAVRYQPE